MEIHDILVLLAIHWLADFKLQSHWMATNKSKRNVVLFLHVAVYTSIWAVFLIIYKFGKDEVNDPTLWFLFIAITFSVHFIQDWVTSRITSKLYAKEEYHWFFCVIGIDQWLHYVQLLVCWKYFVQ